jgi:hypothetical protein
MFAAMVRLMEAEAGAVRKAQADQERAMRRARRG